MASYLINFPVLIASVLFLYVISTGNAKILDKYIGTCHQNDPDFNNCIKDTFNKLQPIIANGLPEYNIRTIDPLFVPRLAIDKIEGMNFKQVLTNMTIRGMKNAKVIRADFSKLPYNAELTWEIPMLNVENEYSMEGYILAFPFRGQGHASLNATTLRSKMKLKLELITKDGVQYLQVKDIKTIADQPKSAKIKFSNNLAKDPQLNEATNKFFNDNWRAVFDIFKNYRHTQMETMAKEGFNKVWIHYPYSQLFPK